MDRLKLTVLGYLQSLRLKNGAFSGRQLVSFTLFTHRDVLIKYRAGKSASNPLIDVNYQDRIHTTRNEILKRMGDKPW